MDFGDKKIIIGLIVVIVAGLASYYFFGLRGNIASAGGVILVSPTEYDLGEVPYEGGIVVREFNVENAGEEDLKISSLETSCGCTSAQIIYEGEESRKFGMKPNTSSWSERINPGDSATLRVFFDPTAHGPEGTGPFRRAIWVQSSGLEEGKTELQIKGTVVR